MTRKKVYSRFAVCFGIFLCRVADSQKLFIGVHPVNPFDHGDLILLDAIAISKVQNTGDIDESKVLEENRTFGSREGGVDEVFKEGVQLERRARNVNELGVVERLGERGIELGHACNGFRVVQKRRFGKGKLV